MNTRLFSDFVLFFSKINTEISIIGYMTLPASAFISVTYTPSGGLNKIHIFKNVHYYVAF